MSTELEQLYQSVILDHNRNPRNFRTMTGADAHADGYNPLCGDRVTVWVRVENGTITDVSFQGEGCAISKASASLMTTSVKGRSLEESASLFNRFHDLVTGKVKAGESPVGLGKLEVFSGVAAFPSRVKCASLPWHALQSALARPGSAGDPDSTDTDKE